MIEPMELLAQRAGAESKRQRQIDHLWRMKEGGVKKAVSLAKQFKLAEKQRRHDFRQINAVHRRGVISGQKSVTVARTLLIHIAKTGTLVREVQRIAEGGDYGLALAELNRAGFDIAWMIANLELMQRFLMEASGVDGYVTESHN